VNSIYMGNNRILTKLFDNSRILLDSRDLSLTPVISLLYIWEPAVTKLYLDLLKEDSIILDIGANVGYFSIIGARKSRKGKVYGFEPIEHTFKLFRDSTYANSFHKIITPLKLAVSDKEGYLNMANKYFMNGGNAIYDKDDIGDRVIEEVKSTTIDRFCNLAGVSKVDIIKIDVEGHEDKAYEGMKETIKNNDLKIIMEFSQFRYEKPKEFFDRIKEDFKYIYLINGATESYKLVRITNYEDLKFDRIFNMLLLSKVGINE